MDYSQILQQVYRDSLGRAPDEAGAAYWSDMLSTGQISPDQLTSIFAASPEGLQYAGQTPATQTTTAASTGATGANGTTPDYASLVNQAYQSQVGRAADTAGLDYWVQQLSKGALTPADLDKAFSATPEGTVYDAYASELYRSSAADPAGLDYWLGLANKGVPLTDIVKAIGASPEAKVQDAYHTVFNRVGDPEGVKYWMDQYAANNMTQAGLEQALRNAGIKNGENPVNQPPAPENPTPVTQRVFTPAEMDQYYTYGQRPEHRFYATRT